MREIAARSSIKRLPNSGEGIGTVSSLTQAEFVGSQDVPLAGSRVDNGYLGVGNVGFVEAHDFQVGTKAVSRTR